MELNGTIVNRLQGMAKEDVPAGNTVYVAWTESVAAVDEDSCP